MALEVAPQINIRKKELRGFDPRGGDVLRANKKQNCKKENSNVTIIFYLLINI